jgi:hypothetical protein
MAIVALLGGDRFATIGGVIAIVIGPVVYWVIRRRPLRVAPPPMATNL